MSTALDHEIESLRKHALPTTGMILGCPLSQIKELSESDIVLRLQRSPSKGDNILETIYREINTERERVIIEAMMFYTSPISFMSNPTPKDVYHQILQQTVRTMRLAMVYNPSYYQSKSANRPQGQKYDMVKINWIDDKGEKVRLVTKTYGKIGWIGLVAALPKMLEAHFGNLTDLREGMRLKQGVRIDLVATIDGVQWAFEFNKINKDQFVETAVRLELWKRYQETYNI